jgi:hypothetical protein
MAWCFAVSVPLWLGSVAMSLHFAFPSSLTDPLVPQMLIGFVAHVLLFFFVVQMYYHVDRSVTLAMLETIFRADPGGLAGPELCARHEISDVIEDRINVLSENGYLMKDDGHLKLTYKGAAIAFITILSTRIFRSKLQKDRIE